MTLPAIASITLFSLSLASAGHDGARSSPRVGSPSATQSTYRFLKITPQSPLAVPYRPTVDAQSCPQDLRRPGGRMRNLHSARG